MLALQDLPGVGSSLADRLSRTLGSEGAVIEALDRGDVASLTAVEGALGESCDSANQSSPGF